MPIEFRCAQCGRLLRTPDDSAGRQAKCPECGNVQVVPQPAPASPPPPVPQAAPSESPFAGSAPPSPGYDPNNPYQAPQYGAGPMPPYPGPSYQDLAATRIQGPAIGLIVTGAIGILLQLVNLAGAVANPQMLRGMNNPNMQLPDIPIAVYIVMYAIALGLGVLIIYSGIKMKNLQSYSLAMASSIIAMIPCISPCCCLGLPIGIWALVVLSDANVKAAFRS